MKRFKKILKTTLCWMISLCVVYFLYELIIYCDRNQILLLSMLGVLYIAIAIIIQFDLLFRIISLLMRHNDRNE